MAVALLISIELIGYQIRCSLFHKWIYITLETCIDIELNNSRILPRFDNEGEVYRIFYLVNLLSLRLC